MTYAFTLPTSEWKAPSPGTFRVVVTCFHPDMPTLGMLVGDFETLDQAYDAADCDDGPYIGRTIRDPDNVAYLQCDCWKNPNDEIEDFLFEHGYIPDMQTVVPSTLAKHDCMKCNGVGMVNEAKKPRTFSL